ncbi:MAG: nucleoside triphosphate pyrophosphohydrolase [Gammaproteobacteria bacterium]
MMSILSKVIQMLKELRGSQAGCAWTQAQTTKSLSILTLEEVYELMDAIEHEDSTAFKDELGDLLYHIIFYAQLAEEQSLFNFDDIAQSILDKRERRLAPLKQRQKMTAEQVDAHWQHAKKKEKATSKNILDEVPQQRPALMRSIGLLKHAAKVGFAWPDKEAVFDKIQEETAELKTALTQQDNQDKIVEEYGDLLFATVSLGQHLGLDPETALRHANKKFNHRFNFIEKKLKTSGKSFEKTDLQEMTSLWQQAKISFQPMQETHLTLWQMWIEKPHVKDVWFIEGYESAEYIHQKIAGNGYDYPFIIYSGTQAIGYIVCCDLYAYRMKCKDVKGLFTQEAPCTFCIDLFITEENNLNKGYGTLIVKSFTDLIFENFDANIIFIDPAITNKRAIRCYEKAGFVFVKQAFDGVSDCYVMQIRPGEPVDSEKLS